MQKAKHCPLCTSLMCRLNDKNYFCAFCGITLLVNLNKSKFNIRKHPLISEVFKLRRRKEIRGLK